MSRVEQAGWRVAALGAWVAAAGCLVEATVGRGGPDGPGLDGAEVGGDGEGDAGPTEPPCLEALPDTMLLCAPPGTESLATLTLSNCGEAPFTLTALTLSDASGGVFRVTAPDALLVAPGAPLKVLIGFAPEAETSYEALLLVEVPGAAPLSVPLSGHAGAPCGPPG